MNCKTSLSLNMKWKAIIVFPVLDPDLEMEVGGGGGGPQGPSSGSATALYHLST